MKELEQLGILNRQLGTLSPLEAERTHARIWGRIVKAFWEAWPEEEPRCIHNYGPGYCPEEGCEFS